MWEGDAPGGGCPRLHRAPRSMNPGQFLEAPFKGCMESGCRKSDLQKNRRGSGHLPFWERRSADQVGGYTWPAFRVARGKRVLSRFPSLLRSLGSQIHAAPFADPNPSVPSVNFGPSLYTPSSLNAPLRKIIHGVSRPSVTVRASIKPVTPFFLHALTSYWGRYGKIIQRGGVTYKTNLSIAKLCIKIRVHPKCGYS